MVRELRIIRKYKNKKSPGVCEIQLVLLMAGGMSLLKRIQKVHVQYGGEEW